MNLRPFIDSGIVLLDHECDQRQEALVYMYTKIS